MVNAHYPKLKPEAVVYYIFFSNLAFYLSLDSFLFRLFEITFFDHFCTVLIKQKPERIWKIKNHILDMLLKKMTMLFLLQNILTIRTITLNRSISIAFGIKLL